MLTGFDPRLRGHLSNKDFMHFRSQYAFSFVNFQKLSEDIHYTDLILIIILIIFLSNLLFNQFFTLEVFSPANIYFFLSTSAVVYALVLHAEDS